MSISGSYIAYTQQLSDAVVSAAKLAAGITPLTLKGTATVSGSAATSMSVTSLDLTTDGCYLIQWAVLTNSGASYVYLEANLDTTTTNYYSTSGTINGASGNTPYLTTSLADNFLIQGQTWMWQDSTIITEPMAFSFVAGITSAGTSMSTLGGLWNHNSATNVTSVQIVSSSANGLDVGSYMKVYKVG